MVPRTGIALSSLVIRETLGIPDCGIYWFPTGSEAIKARDVWERDEHRVLIISEQDMERQWDIPVDMLVINRGNTAIHAQCIYFKGEGYNIVQNPLNLSYDFVERLKIAAQTLADYKSSVYYDGVEARGIVEWNGYRARITTEFDFFGERDSLEDFVIYRQKQISGEKY